MQGVGHPGSLPSHRQSLQKAHDWRCENQMHRGRWECCMADFLGNPRSTMSLELESEGNSNSHPPSAPHLRNYNTIYGVQYTLHPPLQTTGSQE